jgi:hypothetical protein
MDANGVSVAFTSYAIAAVISMLTAAMMALIVKGINASNKRRAKKS